MVSLFQKYLDWRRQKFPSSKYDVDWRHREIMIRLNSIEKKLIEKLDKDIHLTPSNSPETQRLVRNALRYLRPHKVENYNKVRIGGPSDGGYILLDDFNHIDLALSFGISDNDAWDLEIAKKDIQVLQFDHTVDDAPSSHKFLRFHRKMVSNTTSDQSVTLSELVSNHPKSNKPNIILKIDIETCEWDIFDQSDDEVLSQISQIICEYHNLSRLEEQDSITERCVFLKN